MPRRTWLVRLAVVSGLAIAVVLLVNHTLSAQQTSAAAEVRLGARAFGGGSFSIGLQYRVDGNWQTATPSRNILPRSASTNRWHTTSAVEVEVLQARAEVGVLNQAWSDDTGPEQFTVTIGDTRYRARCGRLLLSLQDDGLEMRTGTRNCQDIVTVEPTELAAPTDVGTQVLRVAARRLSNVGIELGLQRLVDGRWEALRQPTSPVLSGLSRNTWRYTSVLDLPAVPAHVSGELRRGASIVTRDGDFDVELDGRVYRTRCGVLDLRILTEHILVDTAADGCHGSAPLLTICPTSVCDVQQNAVYAWESRQVGASLDWIGVTRSEAQALVNAVFADFFPRSKAPTVSFSSEQSHGHAGQGEIVLGTSVRNLGSVVHELAHALIEQTIVRDTGHGRAFTALLLYLWERYFPIADVQAARNDAERHGIEVASRSPIRTRFSEARQVISQLFCDRTATSPELCGAATGAMTQLPDAVFSGKYVGGGSLPNGWYGAGEQAGVGFRSYLAVESNEPTTGPSRARLSIECNTDDELEVDVWWRQAVELPPVLQYRFGDAEWIEDRWYTIGGGTWGEDSWALHRAPDARMFLHAALWHTRSGEPFTVRYVLDGRVVTASFSSDGMFDTPVQPNLVQCGESDVAAGSNDPIIDWGRLGEDFWWGVNEDDSPIKTYVVTQTTIIDEDSRLARMQISCDADALELDVYWDVPRDLDWTVRYVASGGSAVSAEWSSGTGTWGDDVFKWTGAPAEDAGGLIRDLAWAAQSGGTFAIRAHARNDPGQTYTAVFDLDGLFDTPVQPNLARCGR